MTLLRDKHPSLALAELQSLMFTNDRPTPDSVAHLFRLLLKKQTIDSIDILLNTASLALLKSITSLDWEQVRRSLIRIPSLQTYISLSGPFPQLLSIISSQNGPDTGNRINKYLEIMWQLKHKPTVATCEVVLNSFLSANQIAKAGSFLERVWQMHMAIEHTTFLPYLLVR